MFVAPIDYAALGRLAFAGAFAVSLLGTAAVVVPVPYLPIVAQIAKEAPSAALVAVFAATGSVLGETVGFALGRLVRALLPPGRLSDWLRAAFAHSGRAWLALIALSAPLNPLFDVAGIAAGALGVRYPIFFSAVLVGRLIRFAGLAAVAQRFLG